MTVILLVLALACLVAIGLGVALLRGEHRAAVPASGWWQTVRAWADTLQGKRAIAAGIVVAATLLFLLILALRP